MSLYDYLMLKEHKQIIALITKGELVSLLNNGGTYYKLYSLSTFFVQIEFEKWTDKIVDRAIFQSGIQLEKYFNTDLAITI